MCIVTLCSNFLDFPVTAKPYARCTLFWKTWFAVVTHCCCSQKIWQGQRHVASLWRDHLCFLEVGGVSGVPCVQMGNSCPYQVSFDEQHLQAAEKWISKGQVKLHTNQSLCNVLLVEDLGRIAFGLWGCIHSAAWTPFFDLTGETLPRDSPMMTWIFVFKGCRFAWIRTPFVLRSFSSKCTLSFFSWCLLSVEQFCSRGTRYLSECAQTEVRNLGERSHSSQRKICPQCKLLMLRCCSDAALACRPLHQGLCYKLRAHLISDVHCQNQSRAADCTRWCSEEITEAFRKKSFKWE